MELVKEWSAIVSAVLSAAILGVILTALKEKWGVLEQRLQLADDKGKAQLAVLEERLRLSDDQKKDLERLNTDLRRLAEDQKKDLERVNVDLRKVGAAVGIKEFQNPASSVTTGNIGDNFNGRIAGRDINETMQNIGNAVHNIAQKLVAASDASTHHEFKLDYVFGSHQQREGEFQRKIKEQEREGWSLLNASSDYRGIDGMVLVFRKDAANA